MGLQRVQAQPSEQAQPPLGGSSELIEESVLSPQDKSHAVGESPAVDDVPPAMHMRPCTRLDMNSMAQALCIASALINSGVTARQAVSCQFPLQTLYHMVNAMMDGNMGKLLEYWA